jgi:hypothetical protein
MLIKQVLYNLRHSASVYGVGYFRDRVLLYAWSTLDYDSPICASPHSSDERHMPRSPAIGSDGGLMNFLPKLALNYNPPDLHLQSS